MLRLSLVPLLALAAAACDDIGHVTANKGQVCVEREEVLAFKQDGALTLQVQTECVEGCVNTEETWCDAAIDGSTIWLDSRFTWTESEGECAQECIRLSATCNLPVVHPGEYTIRHGREAYALQLPSNPLIECLSVMEEEETAAE